MVFGAEICPAVAEASRTCSDSTWDCPSQSSALPNCFSWRSQKLFCWCTYTACWEERVQCAVPAHRATAHKQLESKSCAIALTKYRAGANKKPNAWQVYWVWIHAMLTAATQIPITSENVRICLKGRLNMPVLSSSAVGSSGKACSSNCFVFLSILNARACVSL